MANQTRTPFRGDARTILAVMSQKGGVGKSGLCRALAVAAVKDDLSVHIADLNVSQQTCYEWARRRAALQIEPAISVDVYAGANQAVIGAKAVDLLIIDEAGESSARFVDIAQLADGVIQPTSARIDDLNPALRLFHELVAKGVPREKLAFLLYGLESEASERFARGYLAQKGYAVLDHAIEQMESYGRAHDLGKSMIETPLPHLNAAARRVCEEILALVKATHAPPAHKSGKPAGKAARA